MLLIKDIPSICPYCKGEILDDKNNKYIWCAGCRGIGIAYENERIWKTSSYSEKYKLYLECNLNFNKIELCDSGKIEEYEIFYEIDLNNIIESTNYIIDKILLLKQFL
jgi:hypothetical protein